ncbi:MAG: amino acid adenylation domain-containing protein, partial [Bacteroidetes bacterium]
DIFANPTIQQLERKIQSSEQKQSLEIPKAPELPYYPLSAAQKRMYFQYQLEPESCNYNIPIALKVYGKIQQDKLQTCFEQLITKHESLRTSFELVDGIAQQFVHPKCPFEFIHLENKELDQLISEFVRPFNLNEAPLFRIAIATLQENEHILLFDIHHIIADGASCNILVSDFIRSYQKQELSPLKIQYKDFAHWQKNYFESEAAKKSQAYWMTQFQGEIPVLNLPTDFKRPPVQDFSGSTLKFKLDPILSTQLNVLARSEDSTTYMILMAGFQCFLSAYTGQEDLIVGSPVAGRNHADLEPLIGMFVNTLAIRSNPDKEISFRDYLQQIRQLTLDAYENQSFPFDELVEKLDLRRDLSRNPLFDVLFAFQNNEQEKLQVHDLNFELLNFEQETSKFDLSLNAAEINDEIHCSFEYATALFSEDTIERMSQHLVHLLQFVCEHPDAKLGQIPLMSSEESLAYIQREQSNRADYPQELTLIQAFENQVQKTPEATALIWGDHRMSYTELNRRANCLAHELRELGIQRGQHIALLIDRNEWMLVGILASLKIGACYVPIDPEYPEERIQFTLQDSEAVALLHTGFPRANYDGIQCAIHELSYEKDHENTISSGQAKDAAYIIYTSGSTGTPKGVVVENQQVISLLFHQPNHFDFTESDTWTLFHSYCFDFSVWEMYGALLFGGKLVLISKDEARDTSSFRNTLLRNQVTVLNQTPAAFYRLAEEDLQHENKLPLRYVIFGGEALHPGQLKAWYDKYPECHLINMYGITETTVHVTYKEIGSKEIQEGISNIGRAIPSLQAYILNQGRQLVPPGVAGELAITGHGVSRGYWKRDDLTQERFIDNPYYPDEKMYLSGDLVRQLPNGEMEYLGRIDQQVKIRGFRIELGEIEAALNRHESIKQSVALTRSLEDGEHKLIAYLLWDGKQELKHQQLRSFLLEQLPEHMIPHFFVFVSEFPLTSNGKIDRKKLPNPDSGAHEKRTYEAPSNEREILLSEVWKQTLGLDDIGVHEDFFSLGGDSIKAIQIASRVSGKGFQMTIKDLFRNSTIRQLAPLLKDKQGIIDQGIVHGAYSPTPIQHWFFDQKFEHELHWNQSLMLYAKDGFDPKIVRQVIQRLYEHHDHLRSILKMDENGRKTLFVPESKPLSMIQEDFKGLEKQDQLVEDRCQEIQAGLTRQNLFQPALFHTDQGDHLLLACHHLLIDGLSWRILLEDFKSLYEAFEKGEKPQLQLKTHSFKYWSEQLQSYLTSSDMSGEINYWKNLCEEEVISLPLKSRQAQNNSGIRTEILKLNEQQTNLLLTKVNQAYRTNTEDLLLSALLMSFMELCEGNRVQVFLEGHGREELFKDQDVSRTVGWFTSLFPVNLGGLHSTAPHHIIRHVKEQLRSIPHKGVGYGVFRYLNDNESDHEINYPESEIMFNYLGQFDEDIQADRWSISHLTMGDSVHPKNHRTSSLDLTGLVVDQQLKLNISYHPDVLDSDFVQELNSLLQQKLEELIQHCVEIPATIPTPSDFELARLTLEDLDLILQQSKDADLQIQNIYPLSPMQEGMLFHHLADVGKSSYFEQARFTLNGHIQKDDFQSAFQKLIDRHDILRTNFFHSRIGQPHQLIFESRKADFRFLDLSNSGGQQNELEELMHRDRLESFDLERAPLMRIHLVKTTESTYEVIWSHHHILMDGWCIALVIQDFMQLYAGETQGTQIQLPAPPSYASYFSWLGRQNERVTQTFWKNYLKEYDQEVKLPEKSQQTSAYQSARVHAQISPQELLQIEQLSRRNQATLNSFMQTSWGILMQRYNRTDDIVFGAVVSGRPSEIEGIEEMIGLFINTIPVRVHRKGEQNFNELLREVQQNSVSCAEHDYYPLSEIQVHTELKRDLISQVLVFENYPVQEKVTSQEKEEDALRIEHFEMHEHTNYDLTLVFIPGQELTIRFEYNQLRYEAEMIEELAQNYKTLISSILKTPEEELSKLSYHWPKAITSGEETIRNPETIFSAFEEIVSKQRTLPAISDASIRTTYGVLHDSSRQLCQKLFRAGVRKGDVVAVLFPRSVELAEALLAISQMGAIYLPIDQELPSERIKFILQDSQCKYLLSAQETNYGPINIPWKHGESFDSGTPDIQTDQVRPEDPAYIIYTSGSTGLPKGVLVHHGGIMHTVREKIASYGIHSSDRLFLFASTSFDASIMELLMGICSGAAIYALSLEEIRHSDIFLQKVRDEGVSILHLPPSYLGALTAEQMPGIRLLITAGEEAPADEIKRFIPYMDYVNAYGPTESSVCCSNYFIQKGSSIPDKVPIGQALPGVKLIVLDQFLQPVPTGVPGELCIAGPGVSLGYLNREELNQEKFIDHEMFPGQKLYRSGDLVQQERDGNILFLGRIDQQVKIRGHRIEPGEIRAQINRISGVENSIVVPIRKGLEKYLCAYYIGTGEINEKDIKQELEKQLPYYLVPDYLVRIEEIPLNNNRKIDLRALPNPLIELDTKNIEEELTETEQRLLLIWKELLQERNISKNSSFFEIGGHSMLLIRMIARMNLQFGKSPEISQLMEAPSIAQIAVLLDQQQTSDQTTELITSELSLFTEERDQKIFLFPPISAHSLIYQELGDYLETHALYGFNYIPENQQLTAFIQAIQEVQPSGPYILGGYSIGGNLARHVAAKLEEMGQEVSHIILIDSTFREKPTSPLSSDEVKANTQEFVKKMDEESKQHLREAGLYEKAFTRIEAYMDFALNSGDEFSIAGQTHLIRSVGVHPESETSAQNWKKLNKGKLTVHQGSGEHQEMLGPDHLKENMKILQEILLKIELSM